MCTTSSPLGRRRERPAIRIGVMRCSKRIWRFGRPCKRPFWIWRSRRRRWIPRSCRVTGRQTRIRVVCPCRPHAAGREWALRSSWRRRRYRRRRRRRPWRPVPWRRRGQVVRTWRSGRCLRCHLIACARCRRCPTCVLGSSSIRGWRIGRCLACLTRCVSGCRRIMATRRWRLTLGRHRKCPFGRKGRRRDVGRR